MCYLSKENVQHGCCLNINKYNSCNTREIVIYLIYTCIYVMISICLDKVDEFYFYSKKRKMI